MSQKIEKLKIQGQEYDISVEKDWQNNDPEALSYIKNRTHYFKPIDNTRTIIEVFSMVQNSNTAEDLLGSDANLTDSIGTSKLSYNWSKKLELAKLVNLDTFKNNSLPLVLEIKEFSEQLGQPALVRLFINQSYVYKIADLGAVKWDGEEYTCQFALSSTKAKWEYLTVQLVSIATINPAYLPVGNNSFFMNPYGQLTFSWEPSEDLANEIKQAIKDTVQNKAELHDWQPKVIKGENDGLVREYEECNICGEKNFKIEE